MLNRYFQKLPMWALVPIMFVAISAMYYGIRVLTGDDHDALGIRLVVAAVYGALLTLVFSIRISRQRRRAGGAAEPARMSAAVRTGQLPADPDPTRWIPELERQQTLFRRNRWTMPVLAIVFAALSIWAAFWINPAWVLFLVLFAVLAAWSVLETRRALRNIPLLLDELRRRPAPRAVGDLAPQPTPGATWPHPGSPSSPEH